jgi:hypothetical protein
MPTADSDSFADCCGCRLLRLTAGCLVSICVAAQDELRLNIGQLIQSLLLLVDTRRDQAIFAFDERRDLLQESHQRRLKQANDSVVWPGLPSPRALVVECALARTGASQRWITRSRGLARRRRREHGVTRQARSLLRQRDERVVERRQRLVIDAVRVVGVGPAIIAIVVAHRQRL